jgi:hypothetical protein
MTTLARKEAESAAGKVGGMDGCSNALVDPLEVSVN